MRRLSRIFLFLLLATAPAVHAQHLSDRPGDSLLFRADLQAVVELQVARDAPVLVELLNNPDAAIRARAALALASVQDSTAVPFLIGRLRDPEATVRADAAFALGQSSGAVDSDFLLEALADESDATVRQRLIEALGKQGNAASLVALVDHAWEETEQAAVALAVGRYALRNVHAEEAVDFLVTSLGAPADTVRLHAAYYFGRSRETDPWQPRADSVRAWLDAMNPADPAAMHLVTGLGRLNDPTDTERLLHWLRHAEDWRTRVNAVRALSSRTDVPGIRAALYDQLVDPSMHVAIAAANALNDGKPWSSTDTDLIQKWIYHNSYAWRITTLLLIGLAQQESQHAFVLNQLEQLRGNPNTVEAYRDALPALRYLPYDDAFNRLVNAAHHTDMRIATTALSTLAARWRDEKPTEADAYFYAFTEGLRQKDLAITSTTTSVLSDSLFQPLGATAVLMEVYETLTLPGEREQMTTILRALGNTGQASADSLLQAASEHDDPILARAGAQALANLRDETFESPTLIPPQERDIDWAYLQSLGAHPQLVLNTTKGPITLVLNTEEAPLTVQTIAQFARDGKYNNVPFHRVVPNFVIQGGDYARRDGYGGPPFAIRSEFTRLPYTRGALGMASSGKDTEGSQFFITHSMQPHLDGRYTAFGYVLEGLDIVDNIYRDDLITSARVVPEMP
ncbi:MAG TPA: peptidylprolyl isomerase [Rhodothermales bacterium]|nr:peptidylprolyl isomerase [Rhodothermales bacterium]